MEGGEVARELWRKSFRSFGQRSKGESLLLTKVIRAGSVVYTLVLPFPVGLVAVCWASAWISLPPHHCVLTLHSLPPVAHALHKKLVVSQRLRPLLEFWCGGCGRLGESGGAMADSHPNAPGACPTSSDAVGPTNEHYNPDVLKDLGDSEAAQQAEESTTRSQMARVGRRIWRIGGRMECNHRRSKVCRIDFCDRLVCVGYSQNTA